MSTACVNTNRGMKTPHSMSAVSACRIPLRRSWAAVGDLELSRDIFHLYLKELQKLGTRTCLRLTQGSLTDYVNFSTKTIICQRFGQQ
jgi:hypothetical protein